MASDTDKSVGEPGLMESLIPVWSSGREAVNHFQHHHYIRGVLWSAMAVSDVFLVKTVVAGGLKLAAKASSSLVVRETAIVAEKATGNMFVSKAGDFLADAKEMAGRIAEGKWRLFSNRAKFFADPGRGYMIDRKLNSSLIRKLQKIIWDSRSFNAISGQYWRISGGANGNSLQHLFFMHSTEWIPAGFRNAGFNLMEVPKSLNVWMGGRPGREWLFRAGVISTLVLSFSTSCSLTNKIMHWIEEGSNNNELIKVQNRSKPADKTKSNKPATKM